MSRKSSSDALRDRTLGAEILRSIVPPLSHADHKGSSGKVGVVGGSLEYTGAPYFAAISGLRLGSDLSHVFCRPDAAAVVKTYSPELIVHPVLCTPGCVSKLEQWLPRLQAVVVGPGLGRDEDVRALFPRLLDLVLRLELLLVVDADGLFLLQEHASKIKGYKKCVLTPNAVEFRRLEEAVTGRPTNLDLNPADFGPAVRSLAAALDGVTVLRKGALDFVSDGVHSLVCSHPGSPRRCGGQGDLLSGVLGTLLFWAFRCSVNSNGAGAPSAAGGGNNPAVAAAYAACLIARECGAAGFERFGRSMLTSDLIPLIHQSLNRLMEH